MTKSKPVKRYIVYPAKGKDQFTVSKIRKGVRLSEIRKEVRVEGLKKVKIVSAVSKKNAVLKAAGIPRRDWKTTKTRTVR